MIIVTHCHFYNKNDYELNKQKREFVENEEFKMYYESVYYTDPRQFSAIYIFLFR